MHIRKIVTTLVFASLTSSLTAAITVSNTAESLANFVQLTGPSGYESTSLGFTTDSSNYTLDSVGVFLYQVPNNGSAINVSIYSDSAGVPGTPLETLTGNNTPGPFGTISAQVITYTSSSLALSANTTYHVVVTLQNYATGSGDYWVQATSSTDETNTGGSSWTLADQNQTFLPSFGSWAGNPSGFATQFSISATPSAIPEPGAYAAFLGLAGTGLVLLRRYRRSSPPARA